MNKIKKNFIYNLIYQILILIIPLISAPYVSRVLGTEGVGTYSYTYSIIYYFMLLTLLGVNKYGSRTIAKVRDNKKELSKTFWSIYMLQLIMGIIMLILYYIYIFAFENQYKTIALIQSLYIISSILDINWLFFGLEEFKVTITRNTLVKIGNIALIMLFVRNVGHTWIYTLILSGTTVLSQLLLWRIAIKRINFASIEKKDVIKHIKPNFILFIPVIAISLYKMMDKVMLGLMSSVTEVGYYENAEKIVNIPMTLITALGTVMLPRISNIVAKEGNESSKKYIEKSIKFVMFMSFAMCFGLVAIGYNFAPLYFGESFQKTGILIVLLAFTLPFLSFANVLRTQFLIPNEKDKIYIISVSLGAVINVIINYILIPKFASIGACLGTIVAEFIVMFYQTISIKKELNIKKYMIDIVPFLIKSLIMFLLVYSINYLNISIILKITLQVILGCTIYALLNIKYIFEIINIKKFLDKLRQKRNN